MGGNKESKSLKSIDSVQVSGQINELAGDKVSSDERANHLSGLVSIRSDRRINCYNACNA